MHRKVSSFDLKSEKRPAESKSNQTSSQLLNKGVIRNTGLKFERLTLSTSSRVMTTHSAITTSLDKDSFSKNLVVYILDNFEKEMTIQLSQTHEHKIISKWSYASFYHLCQALAHNKTVTVLNASKFLTTKRINKDEVALFEIYQCICRDLLVANKTLQKIILDESLITNAVADLLAHALKTTRVRFISLACCEFESFTALSKIIEAVMYNQRIQHADLFGSISIELNQPESERQLKILKNWQEQLGERLTLDTITEELISSKPSLFNLSETVGYPGFQLDEQMLDWENLIDEWEKIKKEGRVRAANRYPHFSCSMSSGKPSPAKEEPIHAVSTRTTVRPKS